MYGFSYLIISFNALTLFKPPKPLLFQETIFNISYLLEILLWIYHLLLPLPEFWCSVEASFPQDFFASLAPSLFSLLALLDIFVTSFLLWLVAKLLLAFPVILVKAIAPRSILAV